MYYVLQASGGRLQATGDIKAGSLRRGAKMYMKSNNDELRTNE